MVAIVVDQLAAWVLDERMGALPANGSFARLRREGTYVREMRYAHALTDTGPGHAALFTGAVPRVSGIVANDVFIDERKTAGVLVDGATRIVSANGEENAAGSSASRFRVPTLADAFVQSHNDGVVISMSLKDRAAIPGGGRKPTLAIWFDTARGGFVTSSSFAKQLPDWVRSARVSDETWTPLDRDWVRSHAASDNEAGEGNYEGLGTEFPHDLGHTSDHAKAFRATPQADEALLNLAERAIAEQPKTKPVFVALSLSANDYIGHVFGPNSWEAWDELLRLDRRLGLFMQSLDARCGPDAYAIALSADHGTVPLPELPIERRPWCGPGKNDRWKRPCTDSARLMPKEIAAELEKAAVKAVGPGEWIRGVIDPYVVFTDAARKLPRGRFVTLNQAVRDALAAHHEVLQVYEVEKLKGACLDETDESIEALVCRATQPDFGFDLFVVTRPGNFFDVGYTPGFGINHGTPYLYDRSVPLLVRAPGRVKAGRLIDEPLGFRTFTKTVASLLRTTAPTAAAGGNDLTVYGEGGSR